MLLKQSSCEQPCTVNNVVLCYSSARILMKLKWISAKLLTNSANVRSYGGLAVQSSSPGIQNACSVMQDRTGSSGAVRRVVVAGLEFVVLWFISSCCGIDISLGHQVGTPHDTNRCIFIAVPAS